MEKIPSRETFPMQTGKITSVTLENYRIKTFEASINLKAKPGQYVLVWVPGVGERPMSIGWAMPLRLTIAQVGPVSTQIHSLRPQDLLSIRGPLGNSFKLPKKKQAHIVLVGGGYGVVPLSFLASEALKLSHAVTVIIGARKKDDLIYLNRFPNCRVISTTDDGSFGIKGNVLTAFEQVVREMPIDEVYSCGPERMMHSLARECFARNIPCQLSIERYMKCGINICGSCALDGKMTCSDGPIFKAKDALKFKDFGNSVRDASGKQVSLH